MPRSDTSYRLASWSNTLPVFVSEALLRIDENVQKVTVGFADGGWCWLVDGRELIVWNCKASVASIQCFVLPLPPSGLSHKADLIAVIAPIVPNRSRRRTPPGCICVSPEGVIRYWSNAAHESSFSETILNLEGQECSIVRSLPGLGFVLATTTCNLVLLQFRDSQAVQTWPVTHLRSAQGVVAGVSRRITSIFYSSSPGTEAKLVQMAVLPVPEEHGVQKGLIYVLTDSSIQCWAVECPDLHKLVWDIELTKPMTDLMLCQVWLLTTPQSQAEFKATTKLWLMDLALRKDRLALLIAGMNEGVSQEVYHLLVELELNDNASIPNRGIYIDLLHKLQGDRIPQLRITYCPESDELFLHNQSNVWLLKESVFGEMEFPIWDWRAQRSVPYDQPVMEPLALKLRPNDKVIGTGATNGTFLVFSYPSGLQYVDRDTPRESLLDTTLADRSIDYSSVNLSTTVTADELGLSTDPRSLFRASFLAFLKPDMKQCTALMESLASSRRPFELDKSVADTSLSIIDHVSAQDTRWKKLRASDVGEPFLNLSLDTDQQLVDKKNFHDYFVSFLKKVDLWDKMGVSKTLDNRHLPSSLLLQENAEKLAAVSAIHNAKSINNQMLNSAIEICLSERREKQPASASSALLPQDRFFRKISCIQDMIPSLVDYESSQTSSDLTLISDRLKIVSDTNGLILTFLSSIFEYRRERGLAYVPSNNTLVECIEHGYCPWLGAKTLRDALFNQHGATVNLLAHLEDDRTKAIIADQLSRIVDYILSEYDHQLQLVSPVANRLSEKCSHILRGAQTDYEKIRCNLIEPLVRLGLEATASQLAEKYEDFGILLALCELEPDRLEGYSKKFASKGFAEYQYQWYLKHGKPAKILALSTPTTSRKLSNFLQREPELRWIYEVQSKDFKSASSTLKRLAMSEESSLRRQKHLLGLAKLAALASDASDQSISAEVSDTNKRLELVTYQERIPETVSAAKGPRAAKLQGERPMNALQLAESYAGDTDGNPLSYKNALDLLILSNVDPESEAFDEIKMNIWCSAILHNDWSQLDFADPLESARNTAFFRAVELVLLYEKDQLALYLPTVEQLLSCASIGYIAKDEQFQYMIKLGFEHVNRLLRERCDEVNDNRKWHHSSQVEMDDLSSEQVFFHPVHEWS